MNDELALLRGAIDGTDEKITELLKRRMELCAAVGEYKRKNGVAVQDRTREETLLSRVEQNAGAFAPYIRPVYHKILEESREYQRQRMRCGLVGEKLPYSFSPRIHSMLADYEYGLFELAPGEVEDFFARRAFHGVNVTIPYKKTVMALCDELTETARRIGCVNTVLRREDGTLLGHNTDYDGFARLLEDSGADVRGRKVLVLGSGGASLTVQTVLRDALAGEIVVISRRGKDNYETIYDHTDAVLLVNATPVGTYPNNGECLVQLDRLPGLETVIDLVYNPARTALLLQAEKRGLTTRNGLLMLTAQAAAAAELFSGRSVAPGRVAEIRESVERREKNILLVGMPGCGKSSVGAALAEKLMRPFTDTDTLIEERSGLSIPEIFARYGEEHFRRLEHAVLEEVTKESGRVIAVGGGAAARQENRDLLRQNSLVIWLERSIHSLPTDGRPLSSPDTLAAMYAERAPLYRAVCDVSFENAAPSPAECAEGMIEEWKL